MRRERLNIIGRIVPRLAALFLDKELKPNSACENYKFYIEPSNVDWI